jgi:hypothetical protein
MKCLLLLFLFRIRNIVAVSSTYEFNVIRSRYSLIAAHVEFLRVQSSDFNCFVELELFRHVIRSKQPYPMPADFWAYEI